MKRGVLIVLGLVFIVVIVVLVVLLARGGSSSNPASKKLKVWSPFNEKTVFDQISQEFKENEADVTIEFSYIEASDAKDYEAKVVNAIANGNGPDVWLVRSDWIPKHVPKSLPAFSQDPKVDPVFTFKQSLQPNLVDLNTYDGKLYGMPISADSLALIYNVNYYSSAAEKLSAEQATSLEGPPDTWAELARRSSLVSKKNAKGEITASAIALGTESSTFASADVLTAFLNQTGSTILSSDKSSVTFNLAQVTPNKTGYPAAEAIDFYASFSRPASANYSWSASSGDPIEAFLAQKTGGLIGYYTTLRDILKKKPSFDITVAPLVQPNEAMLENRVDYANTWSFIVNSETTQGALAWRYLSLFSQEKIIDTYINAVDKLRTDVNTADVKLEPKLLDPQHAYEIFRSQFATAKNYSKPEWQQTDEILFDAIEQATVLGKSAQNSADSAAERMKVFLKPL